MRITIFLLSVCVLLSNFNQAAWGHGNSGSDNTLIERVYQDLHKLNRSGQPLDDDFIKYLAKFQYQEVVEQFLYRLQFEFSNFDSLDRTYVASKINIISAVFTAVLPLLREYNLQDLKTVAVLMESGFYPVLKENMDPEPYQKAVEEYNKVLFIAFQIAQAKDQEPLPSLYVSTVSTKGPDEARLLASKLAKDYWQVISSKFEPPPQTTALVPVKPAAEGPESLAYRDPLASIADVDRVVKYLQARVIGQPEAIERIKNIEINTRLYAGQQTKPIPVMLMGLPGTGKDTIAENWVDAVYGKENAYQDHLFKLPIVKTEADLWGLLGSATGYVGSHELPPFIKWLVNHSGGRYLLKEEKGQSYVIENPKWEPGKIIPGTYPPDGAFVFANEFHNWSKSLKDIFMKQAMEKGYVQINNPGKGVAQIYVPFRLIMASNDGISLVSSREANGQRYGKPLSYDEQLARWENVYRDYGTLKNELLRSNGAVNSPSQSIGTIQPGYSEEFVNRIPNSNLILLRPLSPDNLKTIGVIELNKFKSKIAKSVVKVNLTWDQSVVDLIQEFQYIPEENARPVEFKVSGLIIDTLHEAIGKKLINPSDKQQNISLSIIKNDDRTYTLKLKGDVNLELPIEATSHLKYARPMTDQELQKWFTLAQRLDQKVMGAEFVTKELAREVLLTQEGRNRKINESEAMQPARVFMFLGPSSVGKTEMAKALAVEVFGNVDAMKVYDGGRITNKHQIDEMFYGLRDANGNPIPSQFMKDFDRNNGRLLINITEIANAPREVLKALYDIFREPVLRTCSDGKARAMDNVIIVADGNVGDSMYAQIPRTIPVEEQRAAAEEIYKAAKKSPGYLRMFLEQHFSEPLLARIGEDRIFFFSPLSGESIRKLSIMKVKQAIESLKPTPESRGWDVQFVNKNEYEKFVSVVEDEGFVFREQGASIDRAYKEMVFKTLKEALIRTLAPNGKKVALFVKEITEKNKQTGDPGEVIFGAYVEGQKDPVTFSMKRRAREATAEFTKKTQIATAYHEAGHELARYALFHDVFETQKLTIIPGVTEISGSWVRYLGLVQYEESKYVEHSRNAVIRMMAISTAGYVAQQLVTKGAVDDAGKRNDMEQATYLARMAVLKWGLSKKWGTRVAPSGTGMEEYYASLPDDQKKVVESEVAQMVQEAEDLSRSVLLANYDIGLVPLATKLAEKGTILGDEMAQFYKDNDVALYRESDGTLVKKLKSISVKSLVARFSKLIPSSDKRDSELLPTIPIPSRIATIADVVRVEKEKQKAVVDNAGQLPILKDYKGFEQVLGQQMTSVSTAASPSTKAAATSCGRLLSRLQQFKATGS